MSHEARQVPSWLIFDVGQYPLLYEVRISIAIRMNAEKIDTVVGFGEPWRVAREVTQGSDRNVLLSDAAV